ncbi:MAG: tyrosine--tRNA ligase [Parcubacteria group bacterium]|nr:tyrosine--tRNA ligase [Parcubacteria group bacterium]
MTNQKIKIQSVKSVRGDISGKKIKKLPAASQKSIAEILERGVDEVIGKEHLENDLKEGHNLRIKFGADPTAPDLHLGHAVVLRKLKQFQDLGHTIVFIIGDYTAKIGDPSGKSKTRPQLTAFEIEKNAKTYFEQVGKILNLKKCSIHYNSEWFEKFSFDELIKLASHFPLARILERDDFEKRLKEGIEIGSHEILYPMMQAHDSVVINASVEIGGTDQKFNMLAGRDLQKKMRMTPQEVITCPLLVGLDGVNKMSKSLGNYIAFTDEPREMYGKVMSIPDKVLMHYFELTTELADSELKKIKQQLKIKNPRDVKMRLAREIVEIYHGKAKVKDAEKNFVQVFQKKEKPDQIPTFKIEGEEMSLVDVLYESRLAQSKSDARRNIAQGGVQLNGEVVKDINTIVKKESLIQRGKRHFLKVV